jgi:hypothetical protein
VSRIVDAATCAVRALAACRRHPWKTGHHDRHGGDPGSLNFRARHSRRRSSQRPSTPAKPANAYGTAGDAVLVCSNVTRRPRNVPSERPRTCFRNPG